MTLYTLYCETFKTHSCGKRSARSFRYEDLAAGCEDFWFRFEYNGDFYDLRVWHNKVGEMDIGSSALLDMTLDEFEAQRSELRGRTYVLPLVHFKDYVAE